MINIIINHQYYSIHTYFIEKRMFLLNGVDEQFINCL